MGDRTPGVWITKDKKFGIASAINGVANSYKEYPTVLEENKWILVEISQTLVEGKVRIKDIKNLIQIFFVL